MKQLLLLVLAGAACAAGARPLARLSLRCNDALAELRIDGAPAGTAGDYQKRKLSLRPGRHLFELRSASGEVAVREATLGPGDDVALVVNLGGQDKVQDKGVAQ